MRVVHVVLPFSPDSRNERFYLVRLVDDQTGYRVSPADIGRIILPLLPNFDSDNDYYITFSEEGYTRFLERLTKYGKRLVV